MKTIAIVTDSWHPEMNGVVMTLEHIKEEVEKTGKYKVHIISPNDFKSIKCPTYNEIRLSLFPKNRMKKLLSKVDAVHIATEGPLGISARKICLKKDWPFSSAFHTKLPEYIHAVFPLISLNHWYKFIAKFHKPSSGVLVPTQSINDQLEKYGVKNAVIWSRGVDTSLFYPKNIKHKCKKPVYLYVGRMAIHKNLEAFLDLKLSGTKILVGHGPDKDMLMRKYPDAYFVGRKEKEELAQYYNMADVFVFPSLTDTYGIVQLEAMASGVPVAAYPVPGPIDIIENGVNGWIDKDLKKAIKRALKVSSESCREFALKHTWKACADKFLDNLVFKK